MDPGFSSSKTGLCLCQYANGRIETLIADEYESPDISELLARITGIMRLYRNCKVFCDSAAPFVYQPLMRLVGQSIDYFDRLKDLQRQGYKRHQIMNKFTVHAINFGNSETGGKTMLQHSRSLMDDPAGLVAIHPRFETLLTAIKGAVATEYKLDKGESPNNDVLDAWLMCLAFFEYQYREQQSSPQP